MNYWALIEVSTGRLLRHGTSAVQPRAGEKLVYYPDEATMRKEQAVEAVYEKEKAVCAIRDSEKLKTPHAYERKIQEFEQWVQREIGREHRADLTDPGLIDETEYPYLYAEYWSTYDVDSRSPWELARDGLAKIAAEPAIEAGRRRTKMMNKLTLSKPEPTISHE